jgi:hypothetical protein
MPPTRSVNVGQAGSGTGTVGKATVERMISQNIAITKKTERRRYMVLGGVALVIVVIGFLGVATYLYSRSSASETQLSEVKKELSTAPMDSTAIAKANKSAVVKIDVSWKLISPQGGLVYHQYCEGKPCFVELEDGTIEPLLSYDKERFGETSPAIGGKFSASGVVVSNDGFILTNRHVAAAWETLYEFPPDMFALVIVKSLKGKPDFYRNIKRDPIRWIPSETKQIITTLRGKDRIREGEFNGQNERLDVFFPNMMERNVAQLKKSHEDYDLSMIKVDLPAGLPKAELFDSLKDVKQGDSVFVMGYQRVSIPIYGYKQETSSRASQQKEIPDPNVVSGNIGRLILIQDSPTTRQKLLSEIGNAYQLSVSTQDPGYDGGPVFDNRGRVIGIYSLEKRLEVPTTIAIPIHYGLQLMSVADSGK